MKSTPANFPREDLTIEPGEIHLWVADLDEALPALGLLRGALSAGERRRAAAFRFELHRQRFIAARGVLRDILSRYLCCPPASVAFTYGPHGKPALRNQRSSECQLTFNLSHSEAIALYAIASGRQVGVDIERVRTELNFDDIAEANFTIAELRALGRLPADRRAVGFLNCWTRKEAYVKARGAGLSVPLQTFEVSLAPGDPGALLRTCDAPGKEIRWTVHDVPLGPEFAAAVALEGQISQLLFRQWKVSLEPTSVGAVYEGEIL